MKSSDFEVQKIGLKISSFDKQFYKKQDKEDLQKILHYIKENIWICECDKTNDLNYCSNCMKDIYGFKEGDPKPSTSIF